MIQKFIIKKRQKIYSQKYLSNCVEPIINSLNPKYSKALYLSEIKEFKQKEIAKELNISQGSVKNIIFRGKKHIKDKLLQCCSYEYDSFGNIVDFNMKDKNCNFC